MHAEIIEHRNTIEYWVSEANEILNMMDDVDAICSSLNIAAYLRRFYLEGKRHGVYEYNNNPRD